MNPNFSQLLFIETADLCIPGCENNMHYYH